MTTLAKNPERLEAEIHLQSSRVHFRNILVATDFTAYSAKALRVAVAAARRFAAKVHIVNVAAPAVYTADVSMAPVALERAFANARESMREWAEHPALAGIQHQEKVLEGRLLEELTKYVEENRIDLVVVGTAARKGAEKFLLGSVAESIVRQLACPVMIIGPHVASVPIQYRSIVFATSLNPTSLRAAQYAVGLAEEMDSHLTLLHVEPSVKKQEFDQAERTDIYRRLRSLLPVDSECWCRPKVRLEVGDPAQQILACAVQDDADLIVMSSHRDPMFADHAPWSILGKVASSAKCPILAVHAHIA